jgi:hypothetical protein
LPKGISETQKKLRRPFRASVLVRQLQVRDAEDRAFGLVGHTLNFPAMREDIL